ncbi:MAG: hypothetical protein U5R48_01580 [Gammaproteobacteria bacterium]|nr:hypothetical protein [Gammaproteobacteria bacterium]
MDWGQLPIVKPRSATAASASLPRVPAAKVASRSVSSNRFIPVIRSVLSTTDLRSASTPPQTPEPAPRGIMATPALLQSRIAVAMPSVSTGRITARGEPRSSPSQSRRALRAQ